VIIFYTRPSSSTVQQHCTKNPNFIKYSPKRETKMSPFHQICTNNTECQDFLAVGKPNIFCAPTGKSTTTSVTNTWELEKTWGMEEEDIALHFSHELYFSLSHSFPLLPRINQAVFSRSPFLSRVFLFSHFLAFSLFALHPLKNMVNVEIV